MNQYHEPVLLKEVLEYLSVEPGKKYIDCTLGDGGHTLEILKRGGEVLGIDLDEKALQRATQRIQNEGLDKNFIGVRGNFKNIENISKENGFSKVDGILFDLGYSSFQLDKGEVGLSFQTNEPLDMRLDKELNVTAADLINSLSETELARLFFEYSDERLAKRFARKIVEARKLKEVRTTKQLADLIVEEAPPGYEHGRIHPATRVFQALRIAVNGDLENLSEALPRAAQLLRSAEFSADRSAKPILPGGRMIIISFHSLEDKIAKEFGNKARPNIKVLTKKPLTPSKEEVECNRKARSAKMRIFERKKFFLKT